MKKVMERLQEENESLKKSTASKVTANKLWIHCIGYGVVTWILTMNVKNPNPNNKAVCFVKNIYCLQPTYLMM